MKPAKYNILANDLLWLSEGGYNIKFVGTLSPYMVNWGKGYIDGCSPSTPSPSNVSVYLDIYVTNQTRISHTLLATNGSVASKTFTCSAATSNNSYPCRIRFEFVTYNGTSYYKELKLGPGTSTTFSFYCKTSKSNTSSYTEIALVTGSTVYKWSELMAPIITNGEIWRGCNDATKTLTYYDKDPYGKGYGPGPMAFANSIGGVYIRVYDINYHHHPSQNYINGQSVSACDVEIGQYEEIYVRS